MDLFSLLLQPKVWWEYVLLTIFVPLVAVLFLPAIIVHRNTIIQKVKQNRAFTIIAIFLLFTPPLLHIDISLINSYNILQKYGWKINQFQSTSSTVIFPDYAERNHNGKDSVSIFNPEIIQALDNSEEIGLEPRNYIGEEWEIYSFTLEPDPQNYFAYIGFYEKELVYCTLYIRNNPVELRFLPLSTNSLTP